MNPQPGWYADPSGDPTKLRYWDGMQWTNQYMPAPPSAQAYSNDQFQASSAQQSYAYAQQPANAAYVGSAAVQSATAPGQIYPMTETDRTLRLIAFIWNIVCTVCCCWLIVPLAWMIPMTVHSYGIYKGTKPNSTAFDVCTLLFVGLVSGILLLCSRKDI